MYRFIIDDSIVMLENIYVEGGENKKEAAIKGSREVFLLLCPHQLY